MKNKFRQWATACTCPPEYPVCVCGGKAKGKLITRKPIEATAAELEENRRSVPPSCGSLKSWASNPRRTGKGEPGNQKRKEPKRR